MSTSTKVDNLYKILGVHAHATKLELRNAYLKLAFQYHPDRNPEGEEKFIEICSAYHILTSPERLQQFIGRNDGVICRSDPTDYFQALAEIFGESVRRENESCRLAKMRKEAEIGLDIHLDVPVTLEDIYLGNKVVVKYTRMTVCSTCQGHGETQHQIPCANCERTGDVKTTRRKKKKNGKGYTNTAVKTRCSRCAGTGQVKQRQECTQCRGFQYTEVQETIKVKLPKGGPANGKVRVSERGHETRGKTNILSGLTLVLRVRPHKDFRWIPGTQIISTHVSVTLTEALLGFDRVLVTHLDGRKVRVSHPAGKVIKPGMFKRVPGEGMRFDSGKATGDLVILFDVKFPDKLVLDAAKIDQLKSILPQNQPPKAWSQFMRPNNGSSTASSADDGTGIERAMVDVNEEDVDPVGFNVHCAADALSGGVQVDCLPDYFF